MPLDSIRRTPSPSVQTINNTSLKLPVFKAKSVSTVDLRIEKKGFDDFSPLGSLNDSTLTRSKKNGDKFSSTNDLRTTDQFLADRNYMGPSQRIVVSRPSSSMSDSPSPTK